MIMPWWEMATLAVALCSSVAAVFSAAASFKSASASRHSAAEAERANKIAIHGFRQQIYSDVIWFRGKIVTAPASIDRSDTVKFHQSVEYSRVYFGIDVHNDLKKLLDEVDKYMLSEFRKDLSKQDVVSALRRLADQAKVSIEPHISLSS